MSIVQVSDFGESNGIHTYRVNGNRSDLEEIIEACRNMDTECFIEYPIIEHTFRNVWSVLLQIKVSSQVGDVS